MDYTPLIEWDFIDNDKMIGTLEYFYVLIRRTNNSKPYQLKIFKNGDIWFLLSFDTLNRAAAFAQEIVSKHYILINEKKKIEQKKTNNNSNNIVYIKEWRDSHGSKK